MREFWMMAKSLHACGFLLFSILLVSCHRASREIAVIPRTTSTTLWEAEHAGAEYAANKAGLQIRWNAPTRDDDVREQISMVDREVERKCRGLILTADQPLALMVPVQRAISAGVPTVVLVSQLPLPPQPKLAYVINDDEEAGRMGANRIGQILNGNGRVAVIGIDSQSLSSLAILRSFLSEMRQHYPEVLVIDRREKATDDLNAELVAAQVIQSRSEVNAIFSLDSIDTLGAYSALERRAQTNHIRLVGVEQSAELANAIRARRLDSLIAINTYKMGYLAIELLTHPVLSRVIKLAPFLITADNVDTPAARPFIANDWRAQLQ